MLRRSIYLSFFFIFIPNAFADQCYKENANAWFIGAGAGAIISSMHDNTSTTNATAYNYYGINAPSTRADGFLIAGYQWGQDCCQFPNIDLGIKYNHQFNGHINGFISTPNQYHYQTDVYSDIFTLFGKVDFFEYDHLMPYLAVGIGAAINEISHYSETPQKNNPSRISPNYANKNMTNFTYTLGIGLDFNLNYHVLMTLGYEFEDLGIIKTGNGNGAWTNTDLNFGRLRTNTGFISFSYLIR